MTKQELIKEISEHLNQHYTNAGIAKHLNKENIKTAQGKKWTPQNMAGFIKRHGIGALDDSHLDAIPYQTSALDGLQKSFKKDMKNAEKQTSRILTDSEIIANIEDLLNIDYISPSSLMMIIRELVNK